MERPTVEDIRAEAASIVDSNPPSVVLAKVVLGILFGFAWLLGRLWFFTAGAVTMMGLSLKYGYRKGAKVPTAKRQPAQARQL
jgi:hypothetical protein